MTDELKAAEVAVLEGASLETLRSVWRRYYGAPPTIRSPEILALMLGWRLQAQHEGGLGADLRRALRRPLTEAKPPSARPNSGTILVREWQGARHTVTSLPGGDFLYKDETFASLSEIARRITGTRWNGPRFFGLRGGAS